MSALDATRLPVWSSLQGGTPLGTAYGPAVTMMDGERQQLRVRGASFPSSTVLPAPDCFKVACNLKEGGQGGEGYGKLISLTMRTVKLGKDALEK